MSTIWRKKRKINKLKKVLTNFCKCANKQLIFVGWKKINQ